jgi:hypothetical protein
MKGLPSADDRNGFEFANSKIHVPDLLLSIETGLLSWLIGVGLLRHAALPVNLVCLGE